MEKIIIKAGGTERQYWRDLWKYRELFYLLAWRDLLVRYKQTVVGVAWGLVKPFVTVVVFTIVFGKFGKMDEGGLPPYALVVVCGMLPWQFFSTALSESGNSLVANSNLISKVYFPRLIVPAGTVITSFVDFIIAALFLVVLMAYYHFVPPVNVVWLPVFVVMVFAISIGVGLWLAALMVKYRDFRFIVPFIVQFGIYVSPVGYPTSKATASYGDMGHFVYSLNPLVGIIDGFRWCLLGGPKFPLYWPGQIMSVVGTLFCLLSGVWYFRKTERSFADLV